MANKKKTNASAPKESMSEVINEAEPTSVDTIAAVEENMIKTADVVDETMAEATQLVDESATETAETIKEATDNITDIANEATAEAAQLVEEPVTETVETVKEATDNVADLVNETTAEAAQLVEKPVTETVAATKETETEVSQQVEETEAADVPMRPTPVSTQNKVKEAKGPKNRKLKSQEKKILTMRSRKDLHRELAERKSQLKHTTVEMSAKLKSMIASEIEAYEKRKKRRSTEIMGVFAKHNFYAGGITPTELRTTLEDLGPTYVKIGQIMSSRLDMLPEEYCKELGKLRSSVKPLDAEVARAVIEQETGKTIDEIYSEFRDKPLGSASIGQAHYGVLKDGTKVVTKVQRPLIADMMREDFVLLKKLGGLLGSGGDSGEGNVLDLVSIIEELEKVTEDELDFRIEAENTRFFKENCIEDETRVNCPDVIQELTTERIFTMTFVDGCSIGKKEKLLAEGCDLNAIGEAILENYVHQILDVGTFHGDPHQGNIMVSHGVPYWIDFGMIGRVSDADITVLQNLILSILALDTEALVNAVMALGATSPNTNRAKLTEDLQAFIDKYMSVTDISDLDMAVLLTEITELCNKHSISIPGKFTMLIRSIATIEGVIEDICPQVNLFKILSDKMMARAKKNFDLSQSLISTGREVLDIGKKTAKIPVLASDALNNMVKGRMRIGWELIGYDELLERGANTVKNLTLALFACVLFFGSCILATTQIMPMTRHGMPLLSAIGILFSIILAIHSIRKMTKKK